VIRAGRARNTTDGDTVLTLGGGVGSASGSSGALDSSPAPASSVDVSADS
jgi:hypothetical protein